MRRSVPESVWRRRRQPYVHRTVLPVIVFYGPSAIVLQFSHIELDTLSRGMVTWGSGTTAALTALVLRDRRVGLDLLRQLPIGAIGVSWMGSRTRGD